MLKQPVFVSVVSTAVVEKLSETKIRNYRLGLCAVCSAVYVHKKLFSLPCSLKTLDYIY